MSGLNQGQIQDLYLEGYDGNEVFPRVIEQLGIKSKKTYNESEQLAIANAIQWMRVGEAPNYDDIGKLYKERKDKLDEGFLKSWESESQPPKEPGGQLALKQMAEDILRSGYEEGASLATQSQSLGEHLLSLKTMGMMRGFSDATQAPAPKAQGLLPDLQKEEIERIFSDLKPS